MSHSVGRSRRRSIAVAAAIAIGPVALLAVTATSVGASPTTSAGPSSPAVVFELGEEDSPTFEGRTFGSVGTYEYLIGKVHGQLDPGDPQNEDIVNLDRAPRNEDGMVEYTVDTTILKPVDMSKSNGRLIYDVINRGSQRILSHRVNGGASGNAPRTADGAGTGWLMREGYTMVWSAWQADVADDGRNMVADFPVAKLANGDPITQRTTREWVFGDLETPTVADLVYPTASLDETETRLTVRQHENDRRQVIRDWSFVDEMNVEINRPSGFDNNAIYELEYTAKDPTVMGIGFAATRDIISFLRHDQSDANPLAGTIDFAMAMGISQSGRYLKDFVYQGFNQDLDGRKVFEGILPMVAGSRKTMVNEPFSVPGDYSRQHETHLARGDQFPFTYAKTWDHISKQRDGILVSCWGTKTCPQIFHIDTDTEFYQARASLVGTDTRGRDIEMPSNVRLYYLAAANHTADWTADMPVSLKHSRDPIQWGVHNRALLHAMDRWMTNGTRPPESRWPSVKRGTLVPPHSRRAQYPDIPGWTSHGLVNGLRLNDYSTAIPTEGPRYPVLVAAKDRDGNNLGGIHHPLSAVPIGTHAGWNLYARGYAENALGGLTGSYAPFATTRMDRLATGDERLSLQERYSSQGDYVTRVSRAANQDVEGGYLLREDAAAIVDNVRRYGYRALLMSER